MADLITLANFQTRYGRVMVGEEITRVGAHISDASALVIETAGLDTAWTAATLPAVVLPVVCEVVRRAFDNPAGLQSETIGDYTWRGVKADETSNIYLTLDEKRTIRRAASRLMVAAADLASDLPYGPVDTRLYSPLSTEDGITVINQAEPAD